MRALRYILVCLIFLLSTSHALAASMQKCCANQDCPVSQCQDLGCLTHVCPADTVGEAAVPHAAAAQSYPAQPPARLPASDEEIWTPPD